MNVRLTALELTPADLSGAARAAGVRLPFPLDDVPASSETTRHPELETALHACRAPRLIVYTVVTHASGSSLRVAAVDAGLDSSGTRLGNYAFETTTNRARVYAVAPNGLVQTVVGVVGDAGATSEEALLRREKTVTPRELDDVETDAGRPRATGLLGVVDFAGPGVRHSRSVTWRLYRDGGILAAELPSRPRQQPSVSLRAASTSNLTTACLDLITGVNQAAAREARHG